jgi:hypothetical protein
MARLFMKFHVFHGSGLFNAEAQSFFWGWLRVFASTDYTDYADFFRGQGSGLFHHEGTKGTKVFWGAWLRGFFIHRLHRLRIFLGAGSGFI